METPAVRTVELSVVIAVNAQSMPESLRQVYTDYKDQLVRTGARHEFVFVVEGVEPEAVDTLRNLALNGEPIRIVRLSQSYGDATVLSVGFDNARAPVILTLPAYHQVDPDAIPSIVEALGGSDLLVVRRWPRHDGIISRLQTRIFHYFLRRTVGSNFHDLGCAVRVIRRRVTDAVPIYGHKHWFLPVLAGRQGFKVKEIEVPQFESAEPRSYRIGIYTRRLLDLLSIFFLVKFTKKPLRFFGLTGFAIFGVGFLFTAYLTFERFFMGIPLADRPSLLLGVLMIVLGIQLFAIGLIGELIIFTHARDLQEYTIDEIIN